MSTVFRWISRKFSNASNTAVTKILQSILSKIIDEEADDSVALELFNDWSMNLKLRKIFINPELINGLTDIVSFNSIYVSDLSFDGAYNLSKHFLKVETLVVDMNLHPDAVHRKEDEDLTASIHEFREKMPIQEGTTIKDWILNCVELVKVNVSRLTVILRIRDDLPKLTVEIHDVSFILKHEANALYSGNVGCIKIFHGDGLNKIRVCEAKNVSFMKTNETLSLNFPYANIFVDYFTIESISQILTFVLNLLPNDKGHKSEESKQIVTVSVKKAQMSTSEFIFDIAELGVSVMKNHVDVTVQDIDSPLLKTEGDKPLMISIKLPENGPQEINNNCSISNFVEWESETFSQNILKIKIILPELDVNLPSSRYMSLIKTCLMFPKIAPKIGSHSDSKNPVAVSISVTKLKATIDHLVFFTEKTSLGVFVNVADDLELQLNISATKIFATLFESMLIQSIPDDSAVALVIKLGVNPTVDVNISHFIAAVPRKEGINELLHFLDIVTQKIETGSSHSREENPMKIKINASDIFADYMTYAMPARFIANVLDAKVTLVVDKDIIKGNGTLGVAAYLSNLRQHIPIRALNGQERLFRYGFAQVAKGIVDRMVFTFKKPDSFQMEVESVTLAGGLCSDSLNLLISLYSHLKFGFENGNPVLPQPKIRKAPEEIRDILAESMMQSFIENIPDMEETPKHEEDLSDLSDASLEIQIEKPKSSPNVSIHIKEANVSILLYGGSDFEKIFDLRTLKKAPSFTMDEDVIDDFEYILSRDEQASLEVNSLLSLSISLFKKDPSINMRLLSSISVLDIIDMIPDSKSRLMFGIEKRDASISLLFDILNDESLRLNVELPDIGMFITQQQVDFLISMFSRSIPVFQADTISVPTRFDFFGLKGNKLLINAHFTLFLSVSLEDVLIQLPICALSSIDSIDDLVGRISEFYFDEILWSAFSVAGGLPVINNLRRIGRAVCDLFTNFGWQSFEILMRTVATEALNVGTCATSLTESILKFATNATSGDEDWRRSPIASLIVTHNIGAIPNVVLVPGRKVAAGATRMLRYVKDKINPNKRIDRKRIKL